MLTMTSREFNQDASAAKRAAKDGPVFITDRGKPAHVLLSIEAYAALTEQQNLMDLIGCEAAAEIDFEPGKLQGSLLRQAEFDHVSS